MIRFKLKKEQIEFLKKVYPDNKLIQRVLSFEKEGIFEMDDENTYIDFMDYLDDESVAWIFVRLFRRESGHWRYKSGH